MATRPRKKRRTLKPDGTRNLDMCPCCISFGCDPFSMSEPFRRKIGERLRQHRCPACGKPRTYCSCKSSMDAGKAGAFRKGGNRGLRRAQELIKRKEAAHRWFGRHGDELAAVLDGRTCSDLGCALYSHDVPPMPFEEIAGPLRAAGVDPSPLLPGWEPAI